MTGYSGHFYFMPIRQFPAFFGSLHITCGDFIFLSKFYNNKPSIGDRPLTEAGAWAVKTPGGGFVLTRFLLPFHRLEKEEPVRLEDKRCW